MKILVFVLSLVLLFSTPVLAQDDGAILIFFTDLNGNNYPDANELLYQHQEFQFERMDGATNGIILVETDDESQAFFPRFPGTYSIDFMCNNRVIMIHDVSDIRTYYIDIQMCPQSHLPLVFDQPTSGEITSSEIHYGGILAFFTDLNGNRYPNMHEPIYPHQEFLFEKIGADPTAAGATVLVRTDGRGVAYFPELPGRYRIVFPCNTVEIDIENGFVGRAWYIDIKLCPQVYVNYVTN